MVDLAKREELEKRAGPASRGPQELKGPKGPEDLLEMKAKWLSFPREGKLGSLDLLERVGSSEREVTKELRGHKEEEETLEGMEYLDFRKGSLAEMGSMDFLDSLALQVHQG